MPDRSAKAIRRGKAGTNQMSPSSAVSFKFWILIMDTLDDKPRLGDGRGCFYEEYGKSNFVTVWRTSSLGREKRLFLSLLKVKLDLNIHKDQ